MLYIFWILPSSSFCRERVKNWPLIGMGCAKEMCGRVTSPPVLMHSLVSDDRVEKMSGSPLVVFSNFLEEKKMNGILEIFSQIIGDTIEQNLRVLQAQRGFVFDSGFQESKKSSPSQVLGCGYGLMWKSDKYELSGVSESAEKMTGLIIICLE